MEVTGLWKNIGKERNKEVKAVLVTEEDKLEREKLYSTNRKNCKHPKDRVESFKGVKVCRICGEMVHDSDLAEE